MRSWPPPKNQPQVPLQLLCSSLQTSRIVNLKLTRRSLSVNLPLSSLTLRVLQFRPATSRCHSLLTLLQRSLNPDQRITPICPASLQQQCCIQHNHVRVLRNQIQSAMDLSLNPWSHDFIQPLQTLTTSGRILEYQRPQSSPTDDTFFKNLIPKLLNQPGSNHRVLKLPMTDLVSINHRQPETTDRPRN